MITSNFVTLSAHKSTQYCSQNGSFSLSLLYLYWESTLYFSIEFPVHFEQSYSLAEITLLKSLLTVSEGIPMRETRNNFENQLKVPNFSRKKFNNQICYLLPSIWNKELRKYYLPKRKQSVQMFREDILKKYSDFSCNDRRNCYSCNI